MRPTFPLLPCPADRIALAPEPLRAGGAADGTEVAEIVTFRLADGVTVDAFLDAARQTKPFLDRTGAVRHRTLSQDSDGLWTDHIVWTSMDAAKAAAAEAMTRPDMAAFFTMCDPQGVDMRHARILWQMPGL